LLVATKGGLGGEINAMVTVTLGAFGLSVLAALLALYVIIGCANAVLLWTFLKSWRKAFEDSDAL
jgi:hypothetical protein